MAKFEGFVGPTYTTRAKNFNAERCINLFPEFDQSGHAKSRIAYVHTPGLQTFVTLPTSPVRALASGENRVFAVAGNKLYELNAGNPTGTYTELGTVSSVDTPAQILFNGSSIFVRSGNNGYLHDGVSLSAVQAASWATYLDGYYIALEPNTNTIWISTDGATWDPTDFAVRNGYVDRLMAVEADHGLLWLIGKRNTEVWYNSGNADFPFERVQGGTIEQGILAPDSLAKLDRSLFFVGSDDRGAAAVFRTVGFQLKRISNHAVEHSISDWLPADTAAWTYEQGGHRFYVLTVYGGTQTWVYDVATDMWHERLYWNGAYYESHLGRCHTFASGGFGVSVGTSHLVGSRASGKVYVQSLNLYTDDGAAIRRARRAPHLHNEANWNFYHSLQVDMEVGLFSGTPTASLDWSDDGGYTFLATPKSVSLGAALNYKHRVIWRRLGRARDRVFELVLNNVQGNISIVDAYLEASAGNGA